MPQQIRLNRESTSEETFKIKNNSVISVVNVFLYIVAIERNTTDREIVCFEV